MIEFQSLLDIIDTLGTLGLAALVIYAFLARLVVPRSDVTELEAEHARQLAYVEERRREEREGRVAAEKRVSAFVTSFDEVLAVMRGIKEEVIRGGRRE